ncbi:MAG: hypothetical protein QM500_19570 [Methylococcales bacterium]
MNSELQQNETDMSHVDKAAFVDGLTHDELYYANRFNETTEDDQSYDVSKPMMKRLSELGLVVHKGGGYYEQTDLMHHVRNILETRLVELKLN